MDPLDESENPTTSFLDLYGVVGIEKEEGLKDWSKILVRKKVVTTRARAPIWCVRVQGVTVLVLSLLLLLCMLPIAVVTERSSECEQKGEEEFGDESRERRRLAG